MGKNKEKKIVFSEEIDSSINGFALGISFVFISIFVMYFNIFNNQIIELIVAIVLLIIGIAGTLTEIGKIKKSDIKGADDLLIGLLFTIFPIIVIMKSVKIYLHVLLFILLIFGSFGTVKGVIEIIYSLKIKKRNSASRKVETMKIIVAFTEVIALIVAVLQLIGEIC